MHYLITIITESGVSFKSTYKGNDPEAALTAKLEEIKAQTSSVSAALSPSGAFKVAQMTIEAMPKHGTKTLVGDEDLIASLKGMIEVMKSSESMKLFEANQTIAKLRKMFTDKLDQACEFQETIQDLEDKIERLEAPKAPPKFFTPAPFDPQAEFAAEANHEDEDDVIEKCEDCPATARACELRDGYCKACYTRKRFDM